MYIVIFGANKLSTHIASILSQESHGVFMVDSNQTMLDKVTSELDISTMLDSAGSWEILDKLKEVKPDALLALSENEEKNLTICKIAKSLNYPTTIALLHNETYVHASKLNFNEIFSVDHFICPSLLVSQEIFKYIVTPRSSGAENFAHGAIHMHTMKVPENWDKQNTHLSGLNFPEGLMLGLIRRSSGEEKLSFDRKVIFPHGRDYLLPSDEVTFIGKPNAINSLNDFFQIPFEPVNSVALIGGSVIAINLAKVLTKRGIKTTIIEKNAQKCEELSNILPHSTILNEDGCNSRFMLMEQIGRMDVIVACTSHDEINILASSIGKNLGCEKSVATISEANFCNILEQVHLDYYISPREAMTNRILSILQKQKIIAVASLYENRAKIMELKVSQSSSLSGIPIFELGNYLPNDFLFAAIQNRGRITIADGNKVLCPGDTVIIVTHPRHYNALQRLF